MSYGTGRDMYRDRYSDTTCNIMFRKNIRS